MTPLSPGNGHYTLSLPREWATRRKKSLYAFPASHDVMTWTSTSSSNDAFVVGSSSYASIAKNKQILNKRRHDARDEKKQQKIAESLKSQTLFLNGGRGCGSDGRAVASDARGQRFESHHGQNSRFICQLNKVEKRKIKYRKKASLKIMFQIMSLATMGHDSCVMRDSLGDPGAAGMG